MKSSGKHIATARMRGLSALTSGLVVLFTAAFLGVLSLPLRAQTFYGSVVGAVTDATNAAIPGVKVTLTNQNTSAQRTSQTSAAGNYTFVNLVPGEYKLDFEKTGFKRLTRNVEVRVQTTVRINAQLEIGSIRQTVQVTAQTPLLQTQTASLGHVVGAALVKSMPLNGRNVLALASLVPGVIPQGWAGVNPTNTNNTGWGNFQIGGGLANLNAFYLDGAPLNVNYIDMVALVPTQDAVQEFKVQTNNLSAEWGRFSGGVVNLTTKSGTNRFHGSAYEYLRNTVLNANNFFANRNGINRPPYHQNQFGADLGGPVIKDKTFFFFSYEGYRQRQAATAVSTVPTAEMLNGDFSHLYDSKGNLIPIYDPLTTCGTLNNPACATDANGNPIYTRQQFAGNMIPQNRLNNTSSLLAKSIYPLPNLPGRLDNYVRSYATGGNNDQFNTRIDQNLSPKQRLFGRWTRWSIYRLPSQPLGTPTGELTTDLTNDFVIGDTYTFSPSMVGDLRVSFLRYGFDQHLQTLGMDLTTIGWPASYNAIPNRVTPVPVISGYSGYSGTQVAIIKNRNMDYDISPSMTKITGRHTLKFGAELLRMDQNYLQSNNTSGRFNFNNAFTAINPNAPAGTGWSFASYMLGYGSGGSAVQDAFTGGRQIYEAYYLEDTFQVNRKLTLDLGVRWDLPFGWTEMHDRLTVLQPYAVNPLAQPTGLPLKGALALVNSQSRPDRHNTNSRYNLVVPRIGVAYQITHNTVVRAGYGIYNLPNNAVFNTSPHSSPVNQFSTPWVSTLDGLTPYLTLDNPFPNGVILPIQHNPAFQEQLLGASINSPVPSESYGYMQQWNLNVEHQLGQGSMLQVAYAAAKGVHVPRIFQQINELPAQYLSMGTALQKQVPNPFYGLITTGSLSAPTISQGQLLRPYPEYTGVAITADGNGDSSYNALQAKFVKRFRSAGIFMASYTWAKFMSNVETTTYWEELNVGNTSAAIQDYNNLRAEWSPSSNDVPQNLVLSYAVNLPFGRGQRFLGGVSGVAGKVVSGWGINGITTFQSGLPLGLTTAVNTSHADGGSLRPNLVPGCNPSLSGSGASRIGEWFNTSCFTQPAPFTFGDLSRTMGNVRAAGINNWDFALFKNTKITERLNLQFRAEVFNLFNRVQFGEPGQAFGSGTFGVVSRQENSPRLIQFALRLDF